MKGESLLLYSKLLAVILVLLTFPIVTPAWAHTEEAPTVLATVNKAVAAVLFFDVAFGTVRIDKVDREGMPIYDNMGNPEKTVIPVPFLVMLLIFGGIFFTFWYRWINVRGLKHSIDVIRGKYDKPEDTGEISHFRALTSALSATVGLGNIAGVAIAIQLGGPGAVFWMIIAAVFGMSEKFCTCVLSQMHRRVNRDGTISGGAMYYVDLGLKQMGGSWVPIGKVLGVMYAVMIMGGAIGGGNMFQANQTAEAFRTTFALPDSANWIIGIIMAVVVGIVIIGGIKRIGAATSKIVPAMCGIYVIASLFIILTNITKVPETIGLIFTMAFTNNAFYGGIVGVFVWGIKRASFSNEAGLGSAAIAHAAAKTDEPVREGIIGMIGPFIDTIIVCSMTAIVVIITGTWIDPNIPQEAGVALTTEAFGSRIEWFPYILTISIGLFAYSTMISWCYYGERGWVYLLDHFGFMHSFEQLRTKLRTNQHSERDWVSLLDQFDGVGLNTVIIFRIVFVGFILFGAVAKLEHVLTFSDLMILSMAFPNIVGSIILAPRVLEKVKDYWGRYRSGEMKRVQ